ncbi:MauE/DoxX family redox-associated membrane protein [Marinifilum sp. RC60d5]
MQDKFQDTILPDLLVTPMAYLIPFAEATIGLLLLLNKFTREALIASFI